MSYGYPILVKCLNCGSDNPNHVTAVQPKAGQEEVSNVDKPRQ